MKDSDIFDDIITVLRRQSELTGGLVYVSPEQREMFWNAATRPQVQSDTEVAAPAVHAAAAHERPQTRPVESRVAQPSAGVPVENEVRRPAPAAMQLGNCSMADLAAKVAVCRACRLCEGRTQAVFGSGNPQADLMFIGEGPGHDEDVQGLPFVGKAGQLLTKMITAMQFDRETETFIANIVKCRPPGNRNPEPDEAGACLPYLRRQIELVQPKVLVLLGAVPLKYLLGKTSITRERGRWDEFMGIPVMPTYHPAYLLRYEAGKKEAWSDLQQVMKVFGKVYRKQ